MFDGKAVTPRNGGGLGSTVRRIRVCSGCKAPVEETAGEDAQEESPDGDASAEQREARCL
jgi:hypothetical protein